MSTRIRDLAKSKGMGYVTPEIIQEVINEMIGLPNESLDKQDHYELLREVVEIAAGNTGFGMEDRECCFFTAGEAEYKDYLDLEE